MIFIAHFPDCEQTDFLLVSYFKYAVHANEKLSSCQARGLQGMQMSAAFYKMPLIYVPGEYSGPYAGMKRRRGDAKIPTEGPGARHCSDRANYRHLILWLPWITNLLFHNSLNVKHGPVGRREAVSCLTFNEL